MTGTQGPTVRRRILASELKRLRTAKGVTQHVAAAAVEIEQSALSRYEQAKSSMTVHLAESLLHYYDVPQPQLDALVDLVRGSRKRGWLADVKGRFWEPLEDLVALERDASSIQEMAIQIIPGLLQTENYARSILRAGVVGAEVENHVQSRMSRKEILHGDEPVDYWVIVREAALRCAVGGKAVMREQLAQLRTLAAQSNITLQVIPDSSGEHMAMTTPFSILRFDVAPDYGVVYIDYHTGSLYRDEPSEVSQYDRAYRHLIKTALSEKASITMIEATMEDLYS